MLRAGVGRSRPHESKYHLLYLRHQKYLLALYANYFMFVCLIALYEEEFIEYLLKRKPRDRSRPEFENHSLEHVLSFQRRVHHMKQKFMIRNQRTPIGILNDWWDRTLTDVGSWHAHGKSWRN